MHITVKIKIKIKRKQIEIKHNCTARVCCMSEKCEIKTPTDLCVESKYTAMIAREKKQCQT